MFGASVGENAEIAIRALDVVMRGSLEEALPRRAPMRCGCGRCSTSPTRPGSTGTMGSPDGTACASGSSGSTGSGRSSKPRRLEAVERERGWVLLRVGGPRPRARQRQRGGAGHRSRDPGHRRARSRGPSSTPTRPTRSPLSRPGRLAAMPPTKRRLNSGAARLPPTGRAREARGARDRAHGVREPTRVRPHHGDLRPPALRADRHRRRLRRRGRGASATSRRRGPRSPISATS